MGVSKNRGKPHKMDGLFHGSNPSKWMIWGLKTPLFLVQHPYIYIYAVKVEKRVRFSYFSPALSEIHHCGSTGICMRKDIRLSLVGGPHRAWSWMT